MTCTKKIGRISCPQQLVHLDALIKESGTEQRVYIFQVLKGRCIPENIIREVYISGTELWMHINQLVSSMCISDRYTYFGD